MDIRTDRQTDDQWQSSRDLAIRSLTYQQSVLSAITVTDISHSFYLQDGSKCQLALWNKNYVTLYIYLITVDNSRKQKSLSKTDKAPVERLLPRKR